MLVGCLRRWLITIYSLRITLIPSRDLISTRSFLSSRRLIDPPPPPHSPRSLVHLLLFPESFSTSSRVSYRPRINRRRDLGRRGESIDRRLVIEIVDLIRTDADDMETKLQRLDLCVSLALVSEILSELNNRRVSALRFFNWVVNSHPDFVISSETYNQIIDNFGRVDDYETMYSVLIELTAKQHCLTEKALSFLNVRGPHDVKDLVVKIIEVLYRVGGSCRGTGIFSLIKLLCGIKMFQLAIEVIEETTRKTSYYNVLLAAKCRNGDFHGARDLLDEMSKGRCDPNTNSYNYLLGSLLKNKRVVECCELLQTMEKSGYLPDLVTFEVFTIHACKAGRMDFAMEFLDRMFLEGLKPSLAIHAAFIKGFFCSGRIRDSHKYIVNMTAKDKFSVNMNYSLLASLYHASGNVLGAGRILQELMEKGLKPNFSVFVRVMKDLHRMKNEDLAFQLKGIFSKFY